MKSNRIIIAGVICVASLLSVAANAKNDAISSSVVESGEASTTEQKKESQTAHRGESARGGYNNEKESHPEGPDCVGPRSFRDLYMGS